MVQVNKFMANGSLRISTGQWDFSGGVESGKSTTIASPYFPNGVKRSQICWLGNGTVRGGGIMNRTGYQPIVQGTPWSGLYQGGYLHEPDAANPHLILSIGGRIYQVRVDTDNSVVDLSAAFGLTNPATVEQGFFKQGELFTVIQAGDFVTNPLFWDGITLRRSHGITGITAIGNPNINEIPPAGPMDYYMGRLWYAFGRTYCAGDIVKGPTGTPTVPYVRRDSILKVTESPVGSVGDGFVVPSNAGNIRGITHTAELDTALGQGQLYIGTRKSIYRLQVPVKRTEWIATDNTNNQPFQTVSQVKYGFVNDRSLVRINGDLFYQTLEPGVRSLALAIRYFQQWGNTSISREENRVLAFNDRSLLHAATGIEFNNRVYQSVMPFRTPVGVAHRGLMSLDLDVIGTLQEKLPPAWEGMVEGLDVLQLFEGDFGGLQRAFAVVYSRAHQAIEIWEITQASRTDNGDNRVTRYFEGPSLDWSDAGSSPFKLKVLESMELWLDKIYGTVEFEVYFRPDQHPCWIPWHAWKECAARDCSEDLDVVSCDYPGTPYCEQYRASRTLPKPPEVCAATQRRGVNIGYQFQIKVVTKGWNRVRGYLLHALPFDKRPFENMPCQEKVFYNIEYNAPCPAGFACDPVVVPAGRFFSSVSQADADSKAIVSGNTAVTNNSVPISYHSTQQTINCPAGYTGTPVVVPAGAYVSVVSQADANNQAIMAGTEQLQCTALPVFYNVIYTASCSVGFHGTPVTIPAGTYSSLISQADADAQAVAAANAALVCTADMIYDSFESYSDGVVVNGLNGGDGWDGAYVDRGGDLGIQGYDDFESYSDASPVNGLNGGSGFSGPFIDR